MRATARSPRGPGPSSPVSVGLATTGPAKREIDRLRALVEDQHRRLRVYEAEADRTAPGPGAADVVERFPSRCPKPRVAGATLAGLVAEAEARLVLAESVVGRMLQRGWPEPPPRVPVLRPSPGLPAYARPTGATMPNAVFSLLGLDAAAGRAAVERILREQRGSVPFVPVFLTSDPDFSALRAARLVFEYYPLIPDEAATRPPADWAAYLVDSLQLTMRRWGVRRIVQP